MASCAFTSPKDGTQLPSACRIVCHIPPTSVSPTTCSSSATPAQPTAAVAPVPVQLAPGYGYPFPVSPVGYSLVRGEVLASAGGAGVAQAQVTGTAAAGGWSDIYVTDGTGQWVFAIPDAQAGQITVIARDPAGHEDSAPVTVTASSTIAAPVLIPH